MKDLTREWMVEELKKDEGLILHEYLCDGIPHVGYGFNLKANKLPSFIQSSLTAHGNITVDMADFLLRRGVVSAEADAVQLLPSETWDSLSDKRQAVIAMMIFNMGIGRFQGFHNFLGCLSESDVPGCVREMIDSDWHRNKLTHDRAVKYERYFEEG
jgi:GH24 family phage-related lysozyme (muramidase)